MIHSILLEFANWTTTYDWQSKKAFNFSEKMIKGRQLWIDIIFKIKGCLCTVLCTLPAYPFTPALSANLFGSRYENTPMFEVTTPLWQEVYFQDAYGCRKRNKILFKNAAIALFYHHCICIQVIVLMYISNYTMHFIPTISIEITTLDRGRRNSIQ